MDPNLITAIEQIAEQVKVCGGSLLFIAIIVSTAIGIWCWQLGLSKK